MYKVTISKPNLPTERVEAPSTFDWLSLKAVIKLLKEAGMLPKSARANMYDIYDSRNDTDFFYQFYSKGTGKLVAHVTAKHENNFQ